MRLALLVLLGLASSLPAQTPSFLSEVQPILTRLGCNSGACHGKGAGQNGFRLSLRGFAPEWDHAWITREHNSRRIHPTAPEASLLLLKPLGKATHQGGKLMSETSREYRTLLAWIAGGMPGPSKDEPELRKLEIVPGHLLLKAGRSQTLAVEAEFADGSRKDVTWLTQFFSNDANVAEVSPAGVVKVVREGETAIRGHFLGQVAVALVTVPHTTKIPAESFAKGNNFIDQHVFKKLAELRIEPAPLSGDAMFLRRVYFDTIGLPPTPEEVRAFLKDADPNKRAKVIDQLLERPEFVEFWTFQLGELLQNRKESDHDVRGPKGVRSFHDWLRGQVARNRPWDELTRELLTTTGSTNDHPAVGYYIVTVGENRESHKSTVVANVAQTFLGTRIGCAQCHNHPSEKYTQDDYYHFAGFLSRIKLQRQDPKKGPTTLTVSLPDVKQNTRPVGVTQPRTNKFLPARALDRLDVAIDPKDDPRVALADWIANPKNEYFAGAMVNRLWKHFMGVGLVEPIDDLRASNPPSNPQLWKALVENFVQGKFDRKAMMRHILNSRTYQLSSATSPGNERDQRFYSHYIARRLPAEVLLDAVSQATGVPEAFEGYPLGLRAVQLPDPAVKSRFLEVFGRNERITACACERSSEVTLPQMLSLMGGSSFQHRFTASSGRFQKLLKSGQEPIALAEELYLAVLGRMPTASERGVLVQIVRDASVAEALQDVFTVLLNADEFSFNH